MDKSNFIERLPCGLEFEMVYVEGGTFQMGSEDPEDFEGWAKPVHTVSIPSLYIGKYPVTQAFWRAIMVVNNNPSFFRGDQRPVERVSWEDTQVFLEKLHELMKKPYRLLTEAEWEYAARGGRKSRGFKYSGGNKLKELGWYSENSYGETKAVGLKRPNQLGIYDMSGNVWEWIKDQFHVNYQKAPSDGSAWVDQEPEDRRVIRGGSWAVHKNSCSVSFRANAGPILRSDRIGFRVGLSFTSNG